MPPIITVQSCHTATRLELALPNVWIKSIEQVFLELFQWVETFSLQKGHPSHHENDFDSRHSSSRESLSKRMMEAPSLGSSKPPITERAAFPAWQGGMLGEGSPCPTSDVENCKLLLWRPLKQNQKVFCALLSLRTLLAHAMHHPPTLVWEMPHKNYCGGGSNLLFWVLTPKIKFIPPGPGK